MARAGRRFGCGARQYRRFGRLPCGDGCRAGHRPGGTVCGQVHRSVEDRLAPARAVGISVGSRTQLKTMEAFMLKRGVKPPIGRVYPHAQLDEAINQMRAGQIVGKVVIAL